MPSPLRIAYLLEDTDLSGGVRVQIAQADALIGRGHQVVIFTKGPPLHWRRSRAEWRYIDDFESIGASEFDFVFGGFWRTVQPAYRLAGQRAIHLCQGYEGNFSFYESARGEIESTYRLPIPKLVVSRHLVPVCEQFHSEVIFIGQIVDSEFYRGSIPAENQPLRVLLTGAMEIDLKGVSEGYGAAAHARYYGAQFDLIRVSPWAPGHDEPVREVVQEFHAGLTTAQMARLVHSCDVFIAPNHADEGFGLPAAEALAAGLPAVMTRIPSFLAWDPTPDFALFADPGDAVGLGEQLLELLSDEETRERVRARGREVVEQFRMEQTSERLEKYLLARRELLNSQRLQRKTGVSVKSKASSGE